MSDYNISKLKRSSGNIAACVNSNGTLLTAALRRAQSYSVGGRLFPSANVNEYDLRKVLEKDFYRDSIHILTKKVPEHKYQGYDGIMFARAIKREAASQSAA